MEPPVTRAVCPGCTSEFNAALAECPVCMRPRTKQEIFLSIRGKVKGGKQRERRRYIFAAAAAALVGAAYWALEPVPRKGIGPPLQPIHGKMYGARPLNPEQRTEEHAPDEESPPEEKTPPAEIPAPPEPAKAEPAPPAPEPPKKKAQPYWEIKGLVFDLISAKGITNAHLVFTDRGSRQSYPVKTGAAGAYTAKLPILTEGGYDLAVRYGGRETAFLEDMTPSLRKQALPRRQESLALLNANVLHVPILLEPNQFHLSFDIAIHPRESR